MRKREGKTSREGMRNAENRKELVQEPITNTTVRNVVRMSKEGKVS